ncbi:MAG: response regulator [Candidatus Hydrogenedentes bacterium]|nr:response regulator [Candidatus Hydrogenedentota bacterium]
MPASAPRRGIERKIITSILWVAIIPLLIATLVGLVIAREGQGASVEQTLLTAAQKTTSGLRIAAFSQLDFTSGLASDTRIIAALTPTSRGKPSIVDSGEAEDVFREYLVQRAGRHPDEAFSTVLILYDENGKVVFTSGRPPAWVKEHPDWRTEVNECRYVDFSTLPELKRYVAQTVAPVYSLRSKHKGSEDKIGYVSAVIDVTVLLKFALGYDPYRETPAVAASESDTYQVAYKNSQGVMKVTRLDPLFGAETPILSESEVLDPRIAEVLLFPNGPNSGTVRPARFAATGSINDSFVAYDRIFDRHEIFILVSRSARDVYSIIYMVGALAVGGSMLLVAFLCLNAFRNVHNNIVRPVLLLNEGAQIIGQGDLELKLKIGTGDEIEELATSFNKMALALKGNIRQLEESEEKYRSLVTSMRDGIFQTDPEGIVGFMNPAGAEIFGFGQVYDALGRNIRQMFLEPTDLARFNDALAEEGFVERSRVWMKRQDGRAICVELSGNLMHDDEGEVIGVEGIFRDVTKSVRLEREARDRAERLSAINQIANVINSSLEAGRLYESLVVEVKKLIDFDYAELALLKEGGDTFEARRLWPEFGGTQPREYAIGDERNCSSWVAAKQECLLVDDLGAGDVPFGEQFPPGTKSCLCIPLYATGRIIGTLNLGSNRSESFSHHDVEVLEQMAPHVAVAIRNAQLLEHLQVSLEEVTRAREKLHDANEELKTLDEMKTNLLSNVSHELRTPLVAVMGYTDMIFNGKVGPVNDVQRDYLGISLRNIEKLVTLIENLLDFSRLHRGAETLVFSSFDLAECARLSMQIVQPVADGREIELELLAPPEHVLVEGDKGKMGQVFNNLLSNAVKFNQKGGKVTVEIQPTDASVEVSVRDTGIGIPPEALDKVFTRFYQYDSSSTRKYGGTGIGLSIAQDIARLHGTRITVSSEVGKGSTFRFSLPLREPKRKETADGVSDDVTPPGTRLLIELVTHDRALSMQIRTLLMAEGMDVIHALSAGHAVALAHRHSPDCIIVDLEAADTGNEILDTLLADKASGDLPIIMLTSDEELYGRYRSLVAFRIKRNFRKSALLSAIHYAVGQTVGVAESPGHRILCVDDDAEILTFMVRCLESDGYDVAQCATGEEALALLTRHEFGLVLLDIAMPGIDGWETCRRIKTDPGLAGVKVYMVTAKPIESSSPRFRESGADGYLLKPFHAEDLLELVQGLPILKVTKEA